MLPISTTVRTVNAGDKKNETRKTVFVLIFYFMKETSQKNKKADSRCFDVWMSRCLSTFQFAIRINI